MNEPRYSETLRYPRWWALPALLGMAIPLGAILSHGGGDFIPIAVITVSMLFPVLYLLFAELKITFTHDSFRYSLSLNGEHEYFREDIASIEVKEHEPMAALSGDFNFFRDKKIIVQGSYVIAIRLKSGKRIEISTRDPRAVRRLLNEWWAADGEVLDLHPLTRQAQAAGTGYATEDLV